MGWGVGGGCVDMGFGTYVLGGHIFTSFYDMCITQRGCLTSKLQFFFVIYLFFCFIIFAVISCSSLLSDRPLVKLDAVSGTGRSTRAVADTA
jgi:hypothetical protein